MKKSDLSNTYVYAFAETTSGEIDHVVIETGMEILQAFPDLNDHKGSIKSFLEKDNEYKILKVFPSIPLITISEDCKEFQKG